MALSLSMKILFLQVTSGDMETASSLPPYLEHSANGLYHLFQLAHGNIWYLDDT